jgi:hypothetical protein
LKLDPRWLACNMEVSGVRLVRVVEEYRMDQRRWPRLEGRANSFSISVSQLDGTRPS